MILPEFETGTVVKERLKAVDAVKTYRLGTRLGKGGFAVCYEITPTDSFKTLAAKIIAKQSLANSMAKAKLINEIRIHRSLQHDRIVKFHHFFEDHENVYILLERCRYKTLADLLKIRRTVSEPEARFFILQILDVLEYLRKQRVIHRDLKLGNIFLHDNLCLKIGDFGLAAKVHDANERKTTICGTPNYIAPEILNNLSNGHSFEVDIWSLGVITYTMLVGHPPFESSNIKQTYSKIRANSYEYPDKTPISMAAKDLISRMLVLHPIHLFFTLNVPTALPLSALKSDPFASNPDPSLMGKSGMASSDQENANVDFAVQIRQQFDNLQKAIDRSFAIVPALSGQKLIWSDCVTVLKTLNYVEKYGIGYLTSEGSVGVYYNDGSKIILNPASTVFVYYERYSEIGQVSQYDPNRRYEPAGLQKKVTLLHHFQKHITAGIRLTFQPSNGLDLVYAKKWATTKRSILFALSNGVVQVLFSDRSELVINSDRIARFTDKNNSSFMCHIDRGCHDQDRSDFRRRLDYTKDMLRQMSQNS